MVPQRGRDNNGATKWRLGSDRGPELSPEQILGHYMLTKPDLLNVSRTGSLGWSSMPMQRDISASNLSTLSEMDESLVLRQGLGLTLTLAITLSPTLTQTVTVTVTVTRTITLTLTLIGCASVAETRQSLS